MDQSFGLVYVTISIDNTILPGVNLQMRREDLSHIKPIKVAYKKCKACLLKMKFHHDKILETCTYFYFSFNKQLQKTIGYTIARYVLDLVFGKKIFL
jgi:hypothetical protein